MRLALARPIGRRWSQPAERSRRPRPGHLPAAAERPARWEPAWAWQGAALPAGWAGRRSPRGAGLKRARTRVGRGSRFLVGLDQQPVGIARREIAAEGPQVASLHGVAHRAGDDLA